MRALFVTMIALFALGACNTVTGVGKDLEAGGRVVQDAAEETKKVIQ